MTILTSEGYIKVPDVLLPIKVPANVDVVWNKEKDSDREDE